MITKKKRNKINKQNFIRSNISFLNNKIIDNHDNIFLPTNYQQHVNKTCNHFINDDNVVSEHKNNYDTWFKSSYYYHNEPTHNLSFQIEHCNGKTINSSKYMNCSKIRLLPTYEQQSLIRQHMKAAILMYNETVYFIKKSYKAGERISFKHNEMRDLYMKHIRDNIVEQSHENKTDRIRVHVLDDIIKLVCANYKSALTNLQHGNIKHFRMRYWRFNKTYQILPLRANFFNKQGKLFSNTIGNIKAFKDDASFDLSNVHLLYSSLIYNRIDDTYHLLISNRITKNDLKHVRQTKQKEYIALDPGIRTFMTGISENEVVEYGIFSNKINSNKINSNKINSNKINKYICLINKITKPIKDENNNYQHKRLTLKENIIVQRCRKRIKGHVDELHWKVINNLTKRYNNILIGNFSIKGVVNKNTSKLIPLTKQLGLALSFYKFRQRLQYKCSLKNIKLYIVKENYTSMMCSNCGKLKRDLGGNKTYNCAKCNISIDRDINACRNILMKAL